MWVSKKGIARVTVRTSKGLDVTAGSDSIDGLNGFPVSVGSGILIGFHGKVGANGIKLLKPLCIKRIDSSVVDQVTLEPFDKKQGLTLAAVKTTRALWNGTDYN